MKRLFVFIALLFVLAACSTNKQPTDKEQPSVDSGLAFEAVVGSGTTSDWRFLSYTFTTFVFIPYKDVAKPSDKVNVSVAGPEGWYFNQPLVFEVGADEFGPEAIRNMPNIPLVSGTYTVTTKVNGQTYVTESTADSTKVLPATTVEFSLEDTSASLNWTGIPEAKSYRVYVGMSDLNVKIESTRNLSAFFNDLEMTPADYTGRVTAFNFDVTSPLKVRPTPQPILSISESEATIIPFTEGTFYQVDPSARYLVGDDNDTGKPATAVSLEGLEALPGECLHLIREGDFKSDGSSPELSGDMIAVFQSASGFLMPGANGNQSFEYTSPTAQGKPVDIPEDFWVPGRLITVQIPEGATQLLFSADDVRNSDNSDTNDDFGVRIAKTGCRTAASPKPEPGLPPIDPTPTAPDNALTHFLRQ
ncbi:MAG: hypothetical protein ACRCYY_17735 [Trueperaceae bacterium]